MTPHSPVRFTNNKYADFKSQTLLSTIFIFQMGRRLVSLKRTDFIKKNTNRNGYRLTSPSGEYEFKASSQHPRISLCGNVSRHGGPK
jgi:hypothetical protein